METWSHWLRNKTYLASVPVCPLTLNIIVVISDPYLESSFEFEQFFLPGQLYTFKCCAFWSLMSTMHSSMFRCSLRASCLQLSMKMKSSNLETFCTWPRELARWSQTWPSCWTEQPPPTALCTRALSPDQTEEVGFRLFVFLEDLPSACREPCGSWCPEFDRCLFPSPESPSEPVVDAL